jgi:hypothetical protein
MDNGRALESGSDRLERVRSTPPIGYHHDKFAGNIVLPWNARFWTNSAYTPPSPELLMSSYMMPYWKGEVALPPDDSTVNVTARAAATIAESMARILENMTIGNWRVTKKNSLYKEPKNG